MPDAVKNLLLINLVMFLASILFQSGTQDLRFTLGLHYFDSDSFEPYQVVTHMFMHGGLGHIFFNMFALIMFGSQLERVWGPKRFLTFYFITGLGAVVLHLGVQAFELHQIWGSIRPLSHDLVSMSAGGIERIEGISTDDLRRTLSIYSVPTVGASGAIYGLLLGFAMLFPNTELMLIFLPIPIKAKYFVPFLMLGELYLGVNNFSWDNIAHFAHLGGALFGFIMIMIWKRNRNNFY